jgi:hypothetical protein
MAGVLADPVAVRITDESGPKLSEDKEVVMRTRT